MTKSSRVYYLGALSSLLVLFMPGVLSSPALTEHIEPIGLHDHPAYTHLITVEPGAKMLFVAGQVAADASGKCVGAGDWRAQYVQIMENLKTALAAGGATFADVVFIRRFVTDVDAYFASTRNPEPPLPDYWGGQPPASTLIEVSRLASKCFLMEFDVQAVVSP